MSDGEPLTGDGVTPGIVRIGDTVRRPLRPFSLTVQAYLAHLRDAGFAGAPLPLGVDEQGREVLSYVPGDVPRYPLPPETAGDDVLVALARLIRALHEASAGWEPPPGAVWGGSPANPIRPVSDSELVTHCDYYPGNVVFRDGLPAALIDFDLAHPTTRLYDLANALWYWAPFRDPQDRSPALTDADIPHRVAVFADAYGMTARQRADLAPFAVDLAQRYHQDSRESAELDPVYRKLWEDGARDVLPRAEAWLREAAPAIAARLARTPGTAHSRSREAGHMPVVALRPVEDADLDALFEQMRDPEAVRMAAFTTDNPDDRAAFDAHMARVRNAPGSTHRAITCDGQLVGTIASFVIEGDTEVTYWVDRPAWGRGLASQALKLLLEQVPVRPVHARAASDNIASLRVLQKAGFRVVGTENAYANARKGEIEETILLLE
jgi:RimJ/RimL family protein N-acetyltransferase